MLGVVYLITNQHNQKKYVGQTRNQLSKRWNAHVWAARNSKIPSYHYVLARAIRKYGSDAFVVEQIDTATSIEELNHKEKEWINKLGTFDNGYNMTMGGEGCRRICSESTKGKISAAMTGRVASLESRQKFSKTRTGHLVSVETREKISVALLAFYNTDEGQSLLKEKGQKHSLLLRGKPGHSQTIETRAKIAAARKGVKRKPFTEQHKANMKKALRLSWEKRKRNADLDGNLI